MALITVKNPWGSSSSSAATKFLRSLSDDQGGTQPWGLLQSVVGMKNQNKRHAFGSHKY